MHYQIKYNWTGSSRHISPTKKWLFRIGLTLCATAICAVVLWSMNADWTVTVDALEHMADALQQGSGIKDAFSTFCVDVLKGAEIG